MKARRQRLLGLLVTHALLSGCVSSAEKRLYESWDVNLTQAIALVEELQRGLSEEDLPEAFTQANLAALYDAQLFVVYQKSVVHSGPRLRCLRAKEQFEWLDKRRALAEEAAEEYAGGSLAPVAAARALIELTRERIEELCRDAPSEQGPVCYPPL